MQNIAIVVIAFNRIKSLERLLNSLNNLKIKEKEKITLYISIDRSKNISNENKEVFEYAKKFVWNYGEKIVNYREKNMGLRNHILECGNLTNLFENIIVLEDDVVVSPLMFTYASQVIDFYKNDMNIAGFSLYNFPRNQLNSLPFYPINNGSDVYFMQYACSWGQIWTKTRWNLFYEWYLKNKDVDFSEDERIPKNIRKWGENSWLKFHTIYTILNKKFFVYPQIGLTTNFTDIGTHNKRPLISYQCNTYSTYAKDIKFRFIAMNEANNIYDAFFENMNINKILDCNDGIISDFYGEKNLTVIKHSSNFALSTKKYNYKIIKEYSLQMYPYEMNIINDIHGKDVFLYDLSVKEKNKNKYQRYILLKYLFKLDSICKSDVKNIFKFFVKVYKEKFIKKFF